MTHTVLVIGAGASKEVGLPLGTELKQSICKAMKFCGPDSSGGDVLGETFVLHAQAEQNMNLVNSARSAGRKLYRGLPLARSVDHFVNNHKSDEMLVRVAKWAIAERILHHERHSRLFISSPPDGLDFFGLENTWYMALVSILFEDCQWNRLPHRLERLFLVVFNYDRCIEHFLEQAIAAHYDQSLETARECVRTHLRIFHPYGQVGELSDVANGSTPGIGFGAVPSASELQKLGKSIRTFSERVDENDAGLADARGAIKEARRVVFLGFSYMQINIDLLIPEAIIRTPLTPTQRVIGTAYKMSDLDVKFAKNLLLDRFGLKDENVDLQQLESFNYIARNTHSLSFSDMD